MVYIIFQQLVSKAPGSKGAIMTIDGGEFTTNKFDVYDILVFSQYKINSIELEIQFYILRALISYSM